MVTREQLNNWINGNFSELDRSDLIQLCRYFESKGEVDEIFVEDD